jgi:hypothetical protein
MDTKRKSIIPTLIPIIFLAVISIPIILSNWKEPSSIQTEPKTEPKKDLITCEETIRKDFPQYADKSIYCYKRNTKIISGDYDKNYRYCLCDIYIPDDYENNFVKETENTYTLSSKEISKYKLIETKEFWIYGK